MRTLITAILFIFTMDAAAQAIPRFFFRPIVRPYDYRPVVFVDPITGLPVPSGTPGAIIPLGGFGNSFDPLKNGSNDPRTGIKGFDSNQTWYVWVDPTTGLNVAAGTAGAVRVNWYSMPGMYRAWVDPATGLVVPAGTPGAYQKMVKATVGNPADFNSTQTHGSFSNRRITRWSTWTRGGATLRNTSSNPNLRLHGVVNFKNDNIQFYGAPQRRMIDDANRSNSYLIPPALLNNPGRVLVRSQHLGYTVTDYGVNDGVTAPLGSISNPGVAPGWQPKVFVNPTAATAGWNNTPSTTSAALPPSNARASGVPAVNANQLTGQWTEVYFWYDLNIISTDRAGLTGLRDYSLAGLPCDEPNPPAANRTAPLFPPYNFTNFDVADINDDAENIIPTTAGVYPTQWLNRPSQVQVGFMIRGVRRHQPLPAPNANISIWLPVVYSAQHAAHDNVVAGPGRIAIGWGGTADAMSGQRPYNRSMLWSLANIFGNYFIPGTISTGNIGGGNNVNGTQFVNPSLIANVKSTRSLSTMLQYGDARLKMRLMMRMPHLGPEYYFLNLQNPFNVNGLPNIMR